MWTWKESRLVQRARIVTAYGVFVLVPFAPAACQKSSIAQQGQDRSITAKYTFGELLANLPPEVSVATARAATESTLRSRGYVISSSAGTKDHAEIIARSNVGGRSEKARISLSETAGGTGIVIDAGTFGDEAVSRSMLDGILSALGR